MPLQHGWQHFFRACKYVASSAETPRRRLAVVVDSHFVILKRENLPDQYCWERVVQLIAATTRVTLRHGKRVVEADAESMTNGEAATWLAQIVSLFGDVAEAYGSQIRPVPNAAMAAVR
jgi:hypothetical protein